MDFIDYKFICPECGKECSIEERMENVVVTSVVNYFEASDEVAYGEQMNEDGDVVCYNCNECGYTIKDENVLIDSPEALYDWLKAKGGIIEDDENENETPN